MKKVSSDPGSAISADAATPKSAAFTPGPWQWDSGLVPPDGPGLYADIYVNGGETIIANFNDLLPEGRANARLIAAAPELLEALLCIFDGIEDDDSSDPQAIVQALFTEREIAQARQAIRKALGQ